MLKLTNAMFLSGPLRLSLSVNVTLNLRSSQSYYFQCSWKLFPFLNSIDQIVIDCVG